ncbi:YndJ family transporter [Cellulomonas sp. NPDC057328]|uniref:YndJ family transporter n=1 Tax=Cellulomonas sp. NPDC057328 TaxID=3346101 RepID=UPI003628A9FD
MSAGDGLTPAALAGVQAAVALGAAVVLPLGLRLLADAGLARVPAPRSPAWPVAGALGALALLLPRGPGAVAAAVPFAVAGVVLLGVAARALLDAVPAARSAPRRAVLPGRLAAAVAPGTVAVGALALVADRAGWGVLGFDGDLLLLTVPHMLFAGFGACLAAGLAAAAEGLRPSRLARAGAAGVCGGVLAVLGGYLVSDVAELVGTVVLTGGLWCATAGAWRAARVAPSGPGTSAAPRAGGATALAALAAGASVVAMLLALWWAVGEVTDVPHPDLSWMVATHGALNAVAVVLASLVGLRVRDAPARASLAADAGRAGRAVGGPSTAGAGAPLDAPATDAVPAHAVTGHAVPTHAVPTGAVPTHAVPTHAVPTYDVPTDPTTHGG